MDFFKEIHDVNELKQYIEYFLKWSNLKFVDDITKDVMDNFVAHEMDKGILYNLP